jgi:hypothetical protein
MEATHANPDADLSRYNRAIRRTGSLRARAGSAENKSATELLRDQPR